MCNLEAKFFFAAARGATGAVLEPGKSITLIMGGMEKRFEFSDRLNEQLTIKYLSRRNVVIHRDDQGRRILLVVLVGGAILILALKAVGLA